MKKNVWFSSLEEHKDELDEEESFFEIEDTDQMFSSWSNFLGEAADEDEEPTESNHDTESQKPQEACCLM